MIQKKIIHKSSGGEGRPRRRSRRKEGRFGAVGRTGAVAMATRWLPWSRPVAMVTLHWFSHLRPRDVISYHCRSLSLPPLLLSLSLLIYLQRLIACDVFLSVVYIYIYIYMCVCIIIIIIMIGLMLCWRCSGWSGNKMAAGRSHASKDISTFLWKRGHRIKGTKAMREETKSDWGNPSSIDEWIDGNVNWAGGREMALGRRSLTRWWSGHWQRQKTNCCGHV